MIDWIHAGSALTAASLVAAGFALAAGAGSPLQKAHRWYIRYCRKQCRRSFLGWLERWFVPLVGAASLTILASSLVWPPAAFFLPCIWLCVPFGCRCWIHVRRKKLEAQLPPWLVILSGSLEASPSIGQALMHSETLVANPLRQELGLVQRDLRFGSSFDEALVAMVSRVDSAVFHSVAATIRVAQHTGGNLPVVLNRTADSLREQERCVGVMRSKTAEGKAQGIVLGLIPFAIAGFLHVQDDTHFDSMLESRLGQFLLAVAFSCWLGSLVVARKILAVEV